MILLWLGPNEAIKQYLSAAAEASVGGDAYETVTTPFGLRFLVADARGKGLDAVPSAATVLGSFREWAQHEKDLGDLLVCLNGSAKRYLSEEDFVTALVAQIDGSTLTFAAAGHPCPVRFRSGADQVLQLQPSPPLGLFPIGESPGTGMST